MRPARDSEPDDIAEILSAIRKTVAAQECGTTFEDPGDGYESSDGEPLHYSFFNRNDTYDNDTYDFETYDDAIAYGEPSTPRNVGDPWDDVGVPQTTPAAAVPRALCTMTDTHFTKLADAGTVTTKRRLPPPSAAYDSKDDDENAFAAENGVNEIVPGAARRSPEWHEIANDFKSSFDYRSAQTTNETTTSCDRGRLESERAPTGFSGAVQALSSGETIPANGGTELNGRDLIDQSTANLLRPLIMQWIEDNLPRVVEKALESEGGGRAAQSA